jgi:hypothetical protein
VDHYAVIVAELAWSARLHQLGKWLIQATAHGHNPAEVHTQALDRLTALTAGSACPRGTSRKQEAVVRPLQQRPAS